MKNSPYLDKPTRSEAEVKAEMDEDPKFTLFWRTGDKEIVQGRTIAEAMTLSGYSAGALSALDFYASGENNDYTYDPKNREWFKSR